MRIVRIIATGFLFLQLGCIHSSGPRVRVAWNDVAVCKHCNCYMPAQLPEDAPCPVCECGKQAALCFRGRK